jgi:mRNA-degrading endonuclease YafQ of YafQ-DinJ toxin-antitoxin module
MKIRDVITEGVDRELINSFMPFVQKELGIKKAPEIKIVDTVPGADGTTFGRYVNDEHVIYLVAKNRHPRDVLRTLAHELVHHLQDLEHRLNPNSGETGSDEENEAHARAGVIMRNFNQANPEHAIAEALMACEQGQWILMENSGPIQFVKSGLFDDSLAMAAKRNTVVGTKLEDFIKTKKTDPLQPYGSKDKPFGGDGPIGKSLPKMRYTHLTHDLILFYTIEGRNPTIFKLYGIFNHDDIGIGQPMNIKKQKSFVTKIQNNPA